MAASEVIIKACAEILGCCRLCCCPGGTQVRSRPRRVGTKSAAYASYEEKRLSNRTRVWLSRRGRFCFARQLVALSGQVCQRNVYRSAAWQSPDFAGANLAEGPGVTKSCLDVVGGRIVVRNYSHHPGRSFFLDSHADWSSQKTFGLGPAQPASTTRRFLLAPLF